MDFIDLHRQIIMKNLTGFFADQIDGQEQQLLDRVERELRSLYVRQGNDWTGRGEIGDARLEATIASLEAVRAECLAQLEQHQFRSGGCQ
ncbi:MAG: hypothetical protein R6W66_05365 [Pelovirga sp.]|jgi:hypothetical protein